MTTLGYIKGWPKGRKCWCASGNLYRRSSVEILSWFGIHMNHQKDVGTNSTTFDDRLIKRVILEHDSYLKLGTLSPIDRGHFQH